MLLLVPLAGPFCCACSVYEGGSSQEGSAVEDTEEDAGPESSPPEASADSSVAPSDPTDECSDGIAGTCIDDERLEICEDGDLATHSCSDWCLAHEGTTRADAECEDEQCLCGETCFTTQPYSGIYSECTNPGYDPQCTGFTGEHSCLWVELLGIPTGDAFCTVACTTAAECPASGCSATPTCRFESSVARSLCVLDCSHGRSCPQGMACVKLEDGGRWCY